MKLSNNVLWIVCNPFAAPLDRDGRACALVPVDPSAGGSGYIGARSIAQWVLGRPRSPFGQRSKVSVVYKLAPVRAADTAYIRARIASGEVFAHDRDNYGQPAETVTDEKCKGALISAARSALDTFEREGGDRVKALVAWREQGLTAIADVIDPPAPEVTGGTEPDPGVESTGDDDLPTDAPPERSVIDHVKNTIHGGE